MLKLCLNFMNFQYLLLISQGFRRVYNLLFEKTISKLNSPQLWNHSILIGQQQMRLSDWNFHRIFVERHSQQPLSHVTESINYMVMVLPNSLLTKFPGAAAAITNWLCASRAHPSSLIPLFHRCPLKNLILNCCKQLIDARAFHAARRGERAYSKIIMRPIPSNTTIIAGLLGELSFYSFGACGAHAAKGLSMYIMLNYSGIVHVMASLAAWCKNIYTRKPCGKLSYICCVMMQNCTALSLRDASRIIFFI